MEIVFFIGGLLVGGLGVFLIEKAYIKRIERNYEELADAYLVATSVRDLFYKNQGFFQ